jgi:dipeptidyl-peptidase-4
MESGCSLRPVLLAVLLMGFLSGVAGSSFLAAEEPDASRLSVARILGSGEFRSATFAAQWTEDGTAYERWEASSTTPEGRDLVRYDAETGARRVMVPAADLIPPGANTPLAVDGYAWSPNQALLLIFTNSVRVWRAHTRGDYWLLDRSSHELVRLGGDAPPRNLMFATFSPDNRLVAYVRDRDLYVENVSDHTIRQLTQRSSPDIIHGTFDWVYEEELMLRNGFRWSPDSRQIAYWQIDTSGVREMTLINNTGGLYPTLQSIKYPKAGERNPACRIFVASLETNLIRRIELPGDERDHYLARMEWIPNSHELLLQQLNRLQNRNRVFLVDALTGQSQVCLEERDEAWIDLHDDPVWLAGGSNFTWLSERHGWRQLFVAGRTGGELRLLTPGDYDVGELWRVDEEGGHVYFAASPTNPTQQYLYQVSLAGGDAKRLTPLDQPGYHTYKIAPHARWALHTRSSFGTPPTSELIRLPAHETVRKLEENTALNKKLATLKLGRTELFRVSVAEGLEIDGWCVRPPDFSAEKKYPVIVYVYGEPAGQTVVDRWGGTTYLWHQMLAQQGYVVVSFDNRGTPAPRGRAWRKSVYRQVGILAPEDQAAALRKFLADHPELDASRVGIWGWSGGGSMALNAIFKFPELYHAAIAIAPVPNQRYYDTIYQERYMGLPQTNPDGYLQGSPIHYASQLQGHLLLIHGTGDDNCHYQGTEALINELIRANRPFSMMAYPNRSHAIAEGKNTTFHLYELMTRFFQQHLPATPSPP